MNKDVNLKKSMDTIKRRISEVLKLFKESLEEKSGKKIRELENRLEEVEATNQQNQSADIAAKVNKLDKDYQRKSMALVSEQNLSVSYNPKNIDLIPQKYISSNSKNAEPEKGTSGHALQKNASDDEEYQILQKLEPQMTNSKG